VHQTRNPDAEVAGPSSGQVRAPWKEWLLAVATIGVYAAIRHHRINRELRGFGVEVDPELALLAFFPGAALGVPFLVTVHRTSERIRVAQETVGLPTSIVAWRSTALSVLAFAHIPAEQAALNAVWQADAVTSCPLAANAHPPTGPHPDHPFTDPTRRGELP
jgi:hypothetical protein